MNNRRGGQANCHFKCILTKNEFLSQDKTCVHINKLRDGFGGVSLYTSLLVQLDVHRSN
jgi:hypothetical protein